MSLEDQVKRFADNKRKELLEYIKRLVAQKGAKFISLDDKGRLVVEVDGKRVTVTSIGNIPASKNAKVDVTDKKVEQKEKKKTKNNRQGSTKAENPEKTDNIENDGDTWILELDDDDDRRYNIFLFYGLNRDYYDGVRHESARPLIPNVRADCTDIVCELKPEWIGYPGQYIRESCIRTYSPQPYSNNGSGNHQNVMITNTWSIKPQIYWGGMQEGQDFPSYPSTPVYSGEYILAGPWPVYYNLTTSLGGYGSVTYRGASWHYGNYLFSDVGGPEDCYCGLGGESPCFDWQDFYEYGSPHPSGPFGKKMACSSFPFSSIDKTLVSANMTHTFFTTVVSYDYGFTVKDGTGIISSIFRPAYGIWQNVYTDTGMRKIDVYAYRVNNRTGATQVKVTNIQDEDAEYSQGFIATGDSPFYDHVVWTDDFVNYLWQDDPHREMFAPGNRYFNRVTGTFIFDNYDKYRYKHFAYNKKTGRVWKVVVASASFSYNIWRGVDKFAVWTKKLDPGLSYNTAAYYSSVDSLPVGSDPDAAPGWELLEYRGYPPWGIAPYNTITLGIGPIGDNSD